MADTLELIDLEALLGDIQIPCVECEADTTDVPPATWTASHGREGCLYFLCTPHKEMMQRVFSTQKCDHEHCQCNMCGDSFCAKNVVFCPLEQ